MENEPFDGTRIEFPVSFDLKLIYDASANASTVTADLLGVFARYAVTCARIDRKDGKEGARYQRLSAAVTFTSLVQLRSTYAEIATLPYVKGAL